MLTLNSGQNQPLQNNQGTITIEHENNPLTDVNLTAFLVQENNKVRTDNDMVFYNAPNGENNCCQWIQPQTSNNKTTHTINYDLSKLPNDIKKIVVCLTEDKGQSFSKIQNLKATTENGQTIELPAPQLKNETALIVCEIYVHNGQNKIRSLWQGYNSGLYGLATDRGVEIEEDTHPTISEPSIAYNKPQDTQPTTPSIAYDKPQDIQPVDTKKVLPSAINLEKVVGQVSLKKGDKGVVIEKTPNIKATVSWNSGTDYDVYALVYSKSQGQVDVAMFGARGVPAKQSFAGIRHEGDVQRPMGNSQQVETIEISLTDDILAVVPVAYSAQSNGTGSFYRYKVSLAIDNGAGTCVTINSENANRDDNIYTCVPGIINNLHEGISIEPLELYSKRNSENRPKLQLNNEKIHVLMDQGPRNDYK